MFIRLTMVTLTLLISGCADSDFAGGSENNRGTKAENQSEPGSDTDATSNKTVQSGINTSDDESKSTNESDSLGGEETALLENEETDLDLTECKNSWEELDPFTETQWKHPRVVHVTGEKHLNATFQDNKETEDPALVVIVIDVEKHTSVDLNLQNPQGWYCIKVASEKHFEFNVASNCDAHLGTIDLDLEKHSDVDLGKCQ